MNWGNKIVVSFLVFVVIMTSMVVISMKQDFFLVSKDYYKQEIEYQDQIDRMANQQTLVKKPTIEYSLDSKVLTLTFPKDFTGIELKGVIHLFRPSDATKDQIIKLNLDQDLTQFIDLSKIDKGLWRVKFQWSKGKTEFYEEKVIVI